MRRLESEHLAALAHRRLDLREPGAATRGDHELRGLVRDDAAVAAGIEHLSIECLAVKILGAAATEAQRAPGAARRAYGLGQLLER